MCTRPDSACAAGRADFSLYGYTKEAHHYTALVASILVAEDNPLNFELVRDVLQAAGLTAAAWRSMTRPGKLRPPPIPAGFVRTNGRRTPATASRTARRRACASRVR